MSIERPSQAPAKLEPEENIASEREEDILSILTAYPYSTETEGSVPWFDVQAFNLGLIHLYRAMVEGSYVDRVDVVAYEAFNAMQECWKTNPQKLEGVDNSCIATSPMGQMFCAILHAFSRGLWQDHELLKKAKTITTEEDKKEAQATFFQHFEESCGLSTSFQQRCFDLGIAMVKDMRAHNLEHPEALEYFVPVNYGPWPKRAELVKEFGSESMVALEFTDNFQFTLDKSCQDMPTTPGVEVMCVRHFNRRMENQSVIAELQNQTDGRSPRGYRPGTAGELLCFSRAIGKKPSKRWIEALGSETSVDGDRRVAYLWDGGRGRGLYLDSIKNHRGGDDWFLAVRE